MTGNLLKIIAVAFAYSFVYIAELSFNSEYYHAALSAAFAATATLSTLFAIKSRSKLLLYYASIYIIGAFIYAMMLIPAIAYSAYWFFYEAKVNFSILILFADSLIMVTGGINVIYRLYNLRRHGSSSDDIFNARMGIRKWAE